MLGSENVYSYAKVSPGGTAAILVINSISIQPGEVSEIQKPITEAYSGCFSESCTHVSNYKVFLFPYCETMYNKPCI